MARHPVLMLVFNRPELAEQLARIVASQDPPKVYVACDGPRNPTEAMVVADTRARVRAVLEHAGLSTEFLFRGDNLGCKRGVEEGISWFFEREDAGIILEDDCHPSATFFDFCDLMLDRYETDERVMHISGYSEQHSSGYRFSRFPAVWGWATWRRAWRHYPETLPGGGNEAIQQLAPAFARREHLLFFAEQWKRVRSGDLDTWDFSWVYAVRSQGGLAVQPLVNLVRNVGMGDARAAHTRRSNPTVEANEAQDADLDTLKAPAHVLPDDDADHQFFRSRMTSRLPLLRGLLRTARSAWEIRLARQRGGRGRGE